MVRRCNTRTRSTCHHGATSTTAFGTPFATDPSGRWSWLSPWDSKRRERALTTHVGSRYIGVTGRHVRAMTTRTTLEVVWEMSRRLRSASPRGLHVGCLLPRRGRLVPASEIR